MSDDQAKEQNKDQELAERLRRSEDALASLVGDVDVRAVVEAKQKGVGVKVLSLEDFQKLSQPPQTQNQQAQDKEIDWDSLSNRDLAEAVLARVPDVTRKAVETALKPISDQLSAVGGHVISDARQKMEAEVKKLGDEYPDFKDHVKEMLDLSKQVGNTLGPRELYFLAKARKGEVPSAKSPRPESERPSSVFGTTTRQVRKEPLPRGKKGFTQALRETLDGLSLDLPAGE